MRVKGYALLVGDNIDTDTIIPARYLHKSNPEWLGKHVFEDAPEIKNKLLSLPKPIAIIAGKGFGYGSSREHAVIALKAAEVSLIIARSFHRIFYRNAINNGLPVIEANLTEVKNGDLVEADLENGIILAGNNAVFKFKPMPKRLLEILKHGGLKYFLKKLASEELGK